MKPARIRLSTLLPLACWTLLTISSTLVAQTLHVPIPGKQSILRVGALPDPVTDNGRKIADLFLDGLKTRERVYLQKARAGLEELLNTENVGGDYSALHWMAGLILESSAEQRPPTLDNQLDQSYVDFFFSDNFANLKEYMQRKYGAKDFRPKDPKHHIVRTQFLKDMVIFNNPARSSWDSVTEVLDVIRGLGPDIKKVIDVGAGFGFYSYRIAKMLGTDSAVFAVDTAEPNIDRMKEMTERYALGNIVPVLSTEEDVKVSEQVDLIFISSLYHVLYSWSQHEKRDPFVKSLKEALRDQGYLVILDNNFNFGNELHNSFIEKDFIEAQLYFYGFELVKHKRLTPRRYVLVFKNSSTGQTSQPSFPPAPAGRSIAVPDSRSAVHIGSLDSFDITPPGIAAAEHLYKALEESDPTAARAAIAIYDVVVPKENFGGEYTALRWVAKYLIATDAERDEMTTDPIVAEYLAYLADDGFKKLKRFLSRKYKLEKDEMEVEEALDPENLKVGIVQRQSLEDFLLFNNPERENWEKSSHILKKLPIKPGDTVVDVGSGPGYFSFKFADIVGEEGKVFALDTKKPHIDYIETLVKKWGTKNLIPSVSSNDGLGLEIKDEADLVFMCSLYHILYAVSSIDEREGMLRDMYEVLKPDGRLVIVDNGPVEAEDLPYHGPYIRRELIEAQLAEYGFVLEQTHQIIPQRYMLVFTKG